MGDRRQVVFNGKLWFYTHWGGSSLPNLLQDSIKFAQGRWGDDSYCLRVILTKLFEPNQDEVTGSGVWFSHMDSEYTDFEVNITLKQVKLGTAEWTFEDFIELSETQLNALSN